MESIKEECSTLEEPASKRHTYVGKLLANIEEKLEKLRGQYETQLDVLRAQLDSHQAQSQAADQGNKTQNGEPADRSLHDQLEQVKAELRSGGLAGEQKTRLESLLSDIDQKYQEQLTESHQKHLEDVSEQVKAMRATLEEIYTSQVELIRSEMDTSHQVALSDLRDVLTKEHKDEVNRIEQEWNQRVSDLKDDYDRELRESKLDDSLRGTVDADYISKVNKKLSEEHRQILQKIEKDLDQESLSRDRLPRRQHKSKDAQTDSETDDAESVKSAPVTQEEFEQLEEREAVLEKSEDVRKTLESQYEDIAALRSRMLAEYEQLLSTRAEVMSSQTEEVERLQREMADIQKQYEEQMKTFQAKVEAQAETSMKSQLAEEHEKELQELKQYYEKKVKEMEESYSQDMSQVKEEHIRQLEALKHDVESSPPPLPDSPQPTASEKERDYIRKTTMLTAISDAEDTPPSSPPQRVSSVNEAQLQRLQDQLRDQEKVLDELKKRLEAETNSAEDLHGKLLDSNKTLCEYEDSLKAKADEIEQLKQALTEKDTKITSLESEKAALEEKGEKENGEDFAKQKKVIEELSEKLKKLEEELTASKTAEHRIQQEMNQLNTQHQDAIMALKTEMESLTASRLEDLEAAQKEELQKQAEEMEKKFQNQLKDKTDEITSSYEKQLDELKEKLEESTKPKDVEVVQHDQQELDTSDTLIDRVQLEATIRANVRAELLQEYEQSIDKLKGEYEERIASLNSRLQDLQTVDTDAVASLSEVGSQTGSNGGVSQQEQQLRETMRAELALEYKDKLNNVTQEYETRLKHLQDLVDSKDTVDTKETPSEESTTKAIETTSAEVKVTDKGATEKTAPDYEGFVATLRKEYEEKIKALQSEIDQYRSSLESVPSEIGRGKEGESVAVGGEGQVVTSSLVTGEQGDGDYVQTELKLEQQPDMSAERSQIREKIAEEFDTAFASMKSEYETKLQELSQTLSVLQAEKPAPVQEDIKLESASDMEDKISKLKEEYESKIKELEEKLGKAKAEKLAAEQKVKADMFKWHEETVSQLKKSHEQTITQLRKEDDEKMELYREELQEEFENEKSQIEKRHQRELADADDRYESLVEGLRTGDLPEVASLVQEKFDMELEMAKTLIQQECDETIEAEQNRMSEQHNSVIEKLLNEKEDALQELRDQHVHELNDLRTSLLQQYESQLVEINSQHTAAMETAKTDFEALVEKVRSESASESKATQSEPKPVVESFEAEVVDKSESKPTSIPLSPVEVPEKMVEPGSPVETVEAQQADAGGSPLPEKDVPTQPESTETEEVSETPLVASVAVTAEGKVTVSERTDQQLCQETSQTELDSEIVIQLKQQLAEKEQELTSKLKELDSLHAAELERLKQELTDRECQYDKTVKEMEDRHQKELQAFEERISKVTQDLQQHEEPGPDEVSEDTEALELAHQQELQDLEERLIQKHHMDMDNLRTQQQGRLDDLSEKHKAEVERLQEELNTARQMIVYPGDTMSSGITSPEAQTVPQFHGLSRDMGSSLESRDSIEELVPSRSTPKDFAEEGQEPVQPTLEKIMETQTFDVHSEEETPGVSLQGTLEGVGTLDGEDVKSFDTSLDRTRGSLRGISETQKSEDLLHFSEEDSDHSQEEEADTTQTKSDSSSTPLLQTLAFGSLVVGGPTVKSLDDTAETLERLTDREELTTRIRELESEVDDLKKKLDKEVVKQGDQMERLDREKQEESNLISMLREDIERLNHDRENLHTTNEHLLALLSDSVKTYMGVEENISKKLKAMMEKPQDKAAGAKPRPESAERRKTPPSRQSPTPRSPTDHLSPASEHSAGAEGADGENVQETSVLSNVTDEGLDLSQRISDSIFQGPDLASEEEELLTDSGRRLQSSVSRLLDMIEETTRQLLDTKGTQGEMMDTIEDKGQNIEQLTSRCSDLEERLRDEVERKDFLALELHKAEGLIEGYSSERETLDEKIQELEEQKEALVLELETTKNKLLDMMATHSENESLKKEMHEQQALIQDNVGEEAQVATATDSEATPGDEALMLEVTRLNSENREKEQQIKHVQDQYESRVRELETSGEDMESMYIKLVDEKKQEILDLRLQVEALEKQLKAKKQFIEELSGERDQEHEDYQKELEKWKKLVQDHGKQDGVESRLQREVDDLTEQLQAQVDLYNQAVEESERLQRDVRDKDLSLKELKSIIQQLEQEIQEKTKDMEHDKQKLAHLEDELSKHPYPDDDLTDSSKSDQVGQLKMESPDYLVGLDGRERRLTSPYTVEEELRQAADKTKEELVRERNTLQLQLEEQLKQLSSLRNQLDEMRHRKDISDPLQATRSLEMEREKSEAKDKEISELKLRIETLSATVDNREQQIEHLRSQMHQGMRSSVEEEADADLEQINRRLHLLQDENAELKDQLQKAAGLTSISDVSGLSQNLLDEKNQEIDHLTATVQRLQSDFDDLKTQKGVENVYDELNALKEALQQREKDLSDLQPVQVSATFTDHSITPETSLMNVGASFSDKASILQEMEESEANRLERVVSLETELQNLKMTLKEREEEIVSLTVKLEEKQSPEASPLSMPEDVAMLQELIHEKEDLITQLTVQVDGLQSEVDNLSDFQTKLQEDFDTVQAMLEEKDKEIENLTKELTDKTPELSQEDHALVIKHEVEITRLKKALREKDNVVEEKMEELAEMTDKMEQYEADMVKLTEQVKQKEKEIKKLKRQVDEALMIKPPPIPVTEDEKDELINQKQEEIMALTRKLDESLGSHSPPTSSSTVEEQTRVIKQQKEEIERLKKQVEAALKIRPPSPPLTEDEKMEQIREKEQEISSLKIQIESYLQVHPPPVPTAEDEKVELIRKQEKEIFKLKKQVEEALQIAPPPPPISEEEKDRIISEKEDEIVQLKKELDRVTEAVAAGQQEVLLKEKVGEVLKLQGELTSARREAGSVPGSRVVRDLEENIRQKDKKLKEKDEELQKVLEELQAVKDVRAYEGEMELKEKEDEIEQLQEELQTLRNREQSMTETGDSGDFNNSGKDTQQLQRRLSLFEEQYEQKSAEARQLQVSLDLAKEQLERLRAEGSEQAEGLSSSINISQEEMLEKLRQEKDQEIVTLKEELSALQKRLGMDRDEAFQSLQEELEKAKQEVARERSDNVQTLNDMEKLREKKERERKESLKAVQDLEREVYAKEEKEKELNRQIRFLNEELSGVKGELMSMPRKSSFDMDIRALEREVSTQKEKAAKAGDLQKQMKVALSDKEKYQSQVIQLELEYKNLKEKMTDQVQQLEQQVVNLSSRQTDEELWTQLNATQLRLESTTQQLTDTGTRLSSTEEKLSEISAELNAREIEMKHIQEDLWKTSQQLSITSDRLQDTELKLRQSTSQVTEREDQIHQLQLELQQAQNQVEQMGRKAKEDSEDRARSPQIDELKQQLAVTEAELKQVKQSLKEAVEMSEQQLLMVEQKDQEFVKLKLDIQEMIAEKEKIIREQKQKLERSASNHQVEVSRIQQDLESQLDSVKRASESEIEQQQAQLQQLKENTQVALVSKDQTILDLQQQLAQLRSTPDGAAGDGISAVTNLRTQLQEQEDHIQQLQNELRQMSYALRDKEGEATQAQASLQQTQTDKENTISQLKKELQDSRSSLQTLESELSETRNQLVQLQHRHSEGETPAQGQRSDMEEAERHMQQLRRELLIAKTALMQIQKGGGFVQDGSPEEVDTNTLVQEVMSQPQEVQQQRRHDAGQTQFERMPDMQDVPRLIAELKKTREELELYRNSANLSARDFVQKVMDLKDELSSEHQRHIENITHRSHQEAETQLAQLRIKLEDEIAHLKKLHAQDIEQKLNDLQRTLERKHKGEMNRLVLKHQEEVEVLKTRAVPELDMTGADLVKRLQEGVLGTEQRVSGQRQTGVGEDHGPAMMNGHQRTNMPSKLQNLLQRLHNEGVQVLSISELEYLNRNLAAATGEISEGDVESLRAGWENERQSLLSTIQSLKDLLAQTHKLRGLEKEDDGDDDDFDWFASIEGSDWRAELLRAIGYVFSKERETLLAELRSHVLSHPGSEISEIQRLEQKIRNQEAHQVAALDQIFGADRQSMLAEIRDLRAHATIARMHHQEERERMNERLADTEDQGSKKERQLRRQVQLLEFKIQQEKVLQEDLRSSLDSERTRNSELAGKLNREKNHSLDLQTDVTGLQIQVEKLQEALEREQSRFVSVTSALEEEKSKTLNLTELLESERNKLWRVQEELQLAREQGDTEDPQSLETNLESERERRLDAESRVEIDKVTIDNLKKEMEMERRHQHDTETEFNAKVKQLQQALDKEKHKCAELESAIDRERSLSQRLTQAVEASESASGSSQEHAVIEELKLQLEAERANVRSLNSALHREQENVDSIAAAAESEKNLIQEHLDQERLANHQLKKEFDKAQLERLESSRLYDQQKDHVSRLQEERDQISDELRKMRSAEVQRDREREEDKLADKKAVREAERTREDVKLKLHEQELETQRLTQKILSLEDQLAEARDSEVKVVRELEEEKIRNLQASEITEAASSSGVGNERREQWQVYRSQLESMCQSLHYLILRCREQLNKTTHRGTVISDLTDYDNLQSSLKDLLSEVKQLQEMEGRFGSFPSSTVNERILRHNEELTNFVARISSEKTELRNTMGQLEEDVWHYRQKDAKYQELQRTSAATDDQLFAERAEWAKERLTLQMALNATEREIDQLQTDLRVERERRVAAGNTDATETDRIKIQRLYGKYLRAESFRKALIYQKKYLLLLLGGFQDTEETTLALLARMGAQPALDSLNGRSHRPRPITTFRSAVRAVIAISRMKYLVKKWKRATRVGIDVVTGALDHQTNGYVPKTSSYSPPRHSSSPRYTSASTLTAAPSGTSYHRTLPLRSSDPSSYSSSNIQLEVDTRIPAAYDGYQSPAGASASVRIHTTPPTKDYGSHSKYRSPASGARRKLLTSSGQSSEPGRVRFTSRDGADPDHDDYIRRLESLQTRLGTLQSGKKPTWKQPWR